MQFASTTAEECEALRQFARDYPWEEALHDAAYAAGEVVSALVAAAEDEGDEIDVDTLEMLRVELIESAMRTATR